MIGIDWGTTSLRAYRLLGRSVLDRRDSANGISSIAPGGFESVLLDTVGDWLAQGETDILMAGMIGSRQGWIEAPYLACPAGLDRLASSLQPSRSAPGASRSCRDCAARIRAARPK